MAWALAAAPLLEAQGLQKLTVERINAEPALGGVLPTDVAWTPDGRRVTWLKPSGTAGSPPDLWALESSTGKESLLALGIRLLAGAFGRRSGPPAPARILLGDAHNHIGLFNRTKLRTSLKSQMEAAGVTLVAWAFAYSFTVVQAIEPGSFTAAIDPTGDRSWTELLFLSFTTLSSTGLSDVIPVKPFARSLVMMEQLAGVAYIAMVVSRLVSLTVLRRADTD